MSVKPLTEDECAEIAKKILYVIKESRDSRGGGILLPDVVQLLTVISYMYCNASGGRDQFFDQTKKMMEIINSNEGGNQ